MWHSFVLLITSLRFLQPPSFGISTLDNQPPPPPSFPTSFCCTLLSIPEASAFPSSFLPPRSSPTSCLLQAVQFFGVFGAEFRRRSSKFVFGLLLVACSFRHPTLCKDPLPFSSLSTQKEFTVHVCVCVCVCVRVCSLTHAVLYIINKLTF